MNRFIRTHPENIRVHPLAPAVGLDIDGTLASYYEHFRWFAELYLQEEVTVDWTLTDHMEFSEALNLSKETYRAIKLAYRQGGMKRCLPPMDRHVPGLANRLRYQGMQVWICTTRPWQRLDNIDPDTQFWINNVIGKVDGVIYGEDKYRDFIDILGRKRILGIVDDLPENIVAAQDLGLPAAIRHGEHNEYFNNRGLRLYDGSHIERLANSWYGEYKEEEKHNGDS